MKAALSEMTWEEHRLGRLPRDFLLNLPKCCRGCAFAELYSTDDEDYVPEIEADELCGIDLEKVRPQIPDEIFPDFNETFVEEITEYPLDHQFPKKESTLQLVLFEVPALSIIKSHRRVVNLVYYPYWWCHNETVVGYEEFDLIPKNDEDTCRFRQSSKYY